MVANQLLTSVCSVTLGSHLCGWCRCGYTRKSMQPHHPHREMRTRRRVPLVLMAHCPHWKTQPYWELRTSSLCVTGKLMGPRARAKR
ncbi:unnamed protein product, partial [Staurois parvus]